MIRSVCTLVVLVMACGAPEPPQVAFLLSTLHDERHQKDLKFFEEHARELGVATLAASADGDVTRQLAQVDDALARGAKVLVIEPTDAATAAPFVRLAHERNARVVAFDRAIVSGELDYYVSHDSYRVGVLQAQAALEATHHRGNFVLLSGPADHPAASEITRGYRDTLAPYIARGDVAIVLEQHHAASSADAAQRTVEEALAKSDGKLDAILASTSGMARGAVEAVATAGVPHVFIAGADADATNVNYVCQGKQTIEVLKDIEPLARTAVDVAKQLLDGSSPRAPATIALAGKPVPVAAVRVEIVTPDNVKPLLVDSGFLAASEIPACAKKLAQAR